MKFKQVKQIINEEEILADLTKEEDKQLMAGLKKLKFIEDVESVLRKLPFLKKLVSSKSDEKQLTKELLNRINYARKADDFKYKIDERDIKKPYKKITSFSKNNVLDDNLKTVNSKEEFLNLIKKTNGVFYYHNNKHTFKKIDRDGDIVTKEGNFIPGFRIIEGKVKVLPNNEKNKEIIKSDTSKNLLKKYEENLDSEIKQMEEKPKEITTKKTTRTPEKAKKSQELKIGDKVVVLEGARYKIRENVEDFKFEASINYQGIIREIKDNLVKIELEDTSGYIIIYVNKNDVIKINPPKKPKLSDEYGKPIKEKKPARSSIWSSGPG